jgi:hypothetical protein
MCKHSDCTFHESFKCDKWKLRYPLYPVRNDPMQFAQAIHLLNKNVEQVSVLLIDNVEQ